MSYKLPMRTMKKMYLDLDYFKSNYENMANMLLCAHKMSVDEITEIVLKMEDSKLDKDLSEFFKNQSEQILKSEESKKNGISGSRNNIKG